MTFQVRASNLGFSESGTENRSKLPRISSRVAPTGPGKRNVFYEPDGDSHVAGAHLAEDAKTLEIQRHLRQDIWAVLGHVRRLVVSNKGTRHLPCYHAQLDCATGVCSSGIPSH